MATLASLKTLTNNAKANSGDKVTYLELKAILDATHDELLIRGIKKASNTTALSALSRADAETVIVENLGIFKGSSTGTANGTTIFAASGGGVWILILKTALQNSWNTLTDAATIAVNLNNGPFHKIDMYATRNISFTGAVDGSSIVLKIVHKAADSTVNLPGLLAADFSWATEVNDITLICGVYDATLSQWVWDSKIFYAGIASLPSIISATSVGTNQISVLFDRVVTSTTAGFSFRKNSVALSPSAVSGSGTNTLLFTWGSFAYGDVLDMSYNPSTGNCIDGTGAELAGVTNLSVTNTTPAVPVPVSLTFSGLTGITHTGTDWIANNVSSRVYTSSPTKIAAGTSGFIFCSIIGGNNGSAGFGLVAADGSYNYNAITFGVMPYGGTYQRLPALSSLSVAAAVSDKIGVRRTMAAGVGTVTIELSTDGGTSWTVLYTYPDNFTADLYPVGCIVDINDKLSDPKGLNLV